MLTILTDPASMKLAALALLPADIRDGRVLVGLVVRGGIQGGAAVRLPNGRVVEISGGVMKNIPSRMGRPPLESEERTKAIAVTLLTSQWEAIDAAGKPGERSATLRRIVADWMAKK